MLNQELLAEAGLSEADLAPVIAREKTEARRRVELYRKGRPLASLSGSTALLIDDGLATGATALAAIEMLRKLEASAVLIAAPVGSRSTVARLQAVADRVICPLTPEDFFAIGQFYRDFNQTTDQEVAQALGAAGRSKEA
jgi:predicted phosphoribosyltransferase